MTVSPVFLPWASTCDAHDCVVFDDGHLAPPYAQARIVVASGSEERIARLLDAGASQVLVGECALYDATTVARLVSRYGAERIGVYVPVRRASVNWSLDPHTNADFTCMVTSVPVPRWDVLRANGETTGTDAIWWAEQMAAAGASAVVFATDLHADDLLLAAECIERIGERVWYATRESNPDLGQWVTLAGAHRFVVPDPALVQVPVAGEAA